MSADTPTGIWVAFYSDRSAIFAFPDEIGALRYALDHCCDCVAFRSYGVSLFVGEEGSA